MKTNLKLLIVISAIFTACSPNAESNKSVSPKPNAVAPTLVTEPACQFEFNQQMDLNEIVKTSALMNQNCELSEAEVENKFAKAFKTN